MPRSYRNAFIAALLLHLSIALMFLFDTTSKRPVVLADTKTTHAPEVAISAEPVSEEAVKAVSVDSQEVMEAVNRLKEERLHQQQMEQDRQRKLTLQAEAARKQRIAEQQRLERLKQEAAKLAKAREQQKLEEERRLQQLAKQKAEEEKRIADMKQQRAQLEKQQRLEVEKLAKLQKEKADELARAQQEKEAKEREALAQKQQEAIKQAALEAEKKARIAGEVDKYKALIINAISRQWILPEHVNGQLSSQFRIRLAPNGAVLEVNLTRSSGDPILDRSAQSAIYKASPLPVPNDAEAFNVFRDISLTVRPENAQG